MTQWFQNPIFYLLCKVCEATDREAEAVREEEGGSSEEKGSGVAFRRGKEGDFFA